MKLVRDASVLTHFTQIKKEKRRGGMFGFDNEVSKPQATSAGLLDSRNVDSGDPSKDATLALRLLNAVDGAANATAAVDLLRAASAQRGGCAEADFVLALLHANGCVVPCDHATAASLLRRAALAGHGGAQLRYAAVLSAEGDHGARARFLRRAAEQPMPSRVRAAAALELGGAYAAGCGVEADVTKAALWLSRTAADAAAVGAAGDFAGVFAQLDALLVCANAACPHAGSPAAKQQLRACDSCARVLVCCAACGDAHWAAAHATEEPLYDADADEDEAEQEPHTAATEDAARRTRQRLN